MILVFTLEIMIIRNKILEPTPTTKSGNRVQDYSFVSITVYTIIVSTIVLLSVLV